MPGMTATGNDDFTCGLSIDSFQEAHLGQWTCLLNQNENDRPFHKGVFHMLDNDYVRDIRLPRHVVPDTYKVGNAI